MDIKQSVSSISKFFASGKEIKASKKEVVLHIDDPNDKFFWVQKGCVKVVSYSRSGHTHLHHIFGKNELFPLVNLFRENATAHDYIAISDVTLQVKKKAEVIEFFNSTPQALVAITVQGINAIDHIINLALETAEKRIIHRLLMLDKRFGVKKEGYHLIDIPLTQQEFAESTNVSRETAGRILGRLEKQGLILQGRNHMIIYPDKLAKFLD